MQFIAFGNEPFWSVRVDGQALHWSSPDNLDGVDFVARVEAMERALSQRPGRVDLAVEVPLPDEAGRLALLGLYAPAAANARGRAGPDRSARAAGTGSQALPCPVRRW